MREEGYILGKGGGVFWPVMLCLGVRLEEGGYGEGRGRIVVDAGTSKLTHVQCNASHPDEKNHNYPTDNRRCKEKEAGYRSVNGGGGHNRSVGHEPANP